MEPSGPFCDLGAPVIDDAGALVAIGAAVLQSTGPGAPTQFVDVDAINAILEAEAQERIGFPE